MPEGKTVKTLGLLALAGVEPYQAAQGEEYMNPKQLDHFRRILDAWRQQLREEVDRTKNHMADEAANFPGSSGSCCSGRRVQSGITCSGSRT